MVKAALPALEAYPPALEAADFWLSGVGDAKPAGHTAVSPEACRAALAFAELLEVGDTSIPVDTQSAVDVYTAAALCGEPDAQFTLSALYGLGLFETPRDEAKSSLYLNFAALGGSTAAMAALGYRHRSGVAAPKDCGTALEQYKAAADTTLAVWKTWGTAPVVGRQRLLQEELGAVPDLGTPLAEALQQVHVEMSQADLDTPPSPGAWMARLSQVLTMAYAAGAQWALPEGEDEDVVEFYRNQASTKADAKVHLALGHIHYHGLRGQAHDYVKAFEHFEAAVKMTGAVAEEEAAEGNEPSPSAVRNTALALVGQCFAEGRGVQRDAATAVAFLEEPAKLKHPVALTSLAALVLSGESDFGFGSGELEALEADGGEGQDEAPPQAASSALDPSSARDRAVVATRLLSAAASSGHMAAQHNLGLLYLQGQLGERSFSKARKHFAMAAQQGFIPSLMAMANMHAHGLGMPASCSTAVRLFRNVVHRGHLALTLDSAHRRVRSAAPAQAVLPIAQPTQDSTKVAFHSQLRRQSPRSSDGVLLGAGEWLQGAYHGKGAEALRGAMLEYVRAAHAGFEVAQWNAALLLKVYGADAFGSMVGGGDQALEELDPQIQLLLMNAAHGHVRAHLEVADAVFYGRHGLDASPMEASHHYRAAAGLRSGQALFNLGAMHEYGMGLPVDLHLAKRYYDQALKADEAGWLPVTMALEGLKLKQAVASWLAEHPTWCTALHTHAQPLVDLLRWARWEGAVQCNAAAAKDAQSSPPVQGPAAAGQQPPPLAQKGASQKELRAAAIAESARRRQERRKAQGKPPSLPQRLFDSLLRTARAVAQHTRRLVLNLYSSGLSQISAEDQLFLLGTLVACVVMLARARAARAAAAAQQ